MSFDAQIFKQYKDLFGSATKKVIKEKLSKNPQKLKEYETEIITTHDQISKYIAPFFNKFDSVDKAFYRKELIYIRDRTLRCFGALKCNIRVSQVPTDLIENANELTDVSENSENESDEEEYNRTIVSNENEFETSMSGNDNLTNDNLPPTTSKTNSTDIVTNSLSTPISNINDDNMAPIPLLDYLRFAASTLNKNYAGEPLGLNAFINAVELIKSVDTEKSYGTQLKTFVLAKLEGKALESVPQEGSLDDIIKALKEKIKPENSKVISGKMLSLRYNKNSASTFTAEAEKLADALQRTLIVEGISQTKAREMAVERTVEMCRQSAKYDLVKSVLAAATFTDPKDVIAKLITEQNTHETEKQILAFNRNNNFRKNNGRFNGNKGFNNRQNGHKNFQNNGNFNGNRGGYNKRGRGRGNYYNNNRNNNNNGNYNVRVAENYESPSTSDGQSKSQSQSFTLERANNR